MQEKNDEGSTVLLTIQTLKELSYLYNRTGFMEEGKIYGSMTESGADLISYFDKVESGGYNKIFELRCGIWFEYCQLVLNKLEQNIKTIIKNFGKIGDFYPQFKDLEKKLTDLGAVQSSENKLKDMKQLFEETFAFNKKIEKQLPIIVNEGCSEYFTKRFLPLLAIISAAYFGMIYTFRDDIAKAVNQPEFQLIHIGAIFILWLVLSVALYYAVKFILRPRL